MIRPDLTGHLRQQSSTRKPTVLEFAAYADGWRWSLSDSLGNVLTVSKPFGSRQSANRNANLVLGPHTRKRQGQDGNGFEVHR